MAFKSLLTWPCPLRQPQSTGSPVLRVSASPLGLCSSPSCCITSCFCVFAHVSLTGLPLPLLTHLQLSLPHKVSFKTRFGCHAFQEVSPDLSFLPGWHLWKHFYIFVISFSLHFMALWVHVCSFLRTRTMSLWHLCPRRSPGPGKWWVHC